MDDLAVRGHGSSSLSTILCTVDLLTPATAAIRRTEAPWACQARMASSRRLAALRASWAQFLTACSHVHGALTRPALSEQPHADGP